MRIGDKVCLVTPGNVRLHVTVATIASLPPWGAHVLAPAAATGRFRALFSEMQELAAATGEACPKCGSFQMVRTGACITCQDCGENSGCG